MRSTHGGKLIILVSKKCICEELTMCLCRHHSTTDIQHSHIVSNNLIGQLGRGGKSSKPSKALFSNPHVAKDSSEGIRNTHVDVKASKAYTGGTKDAGHSAVIDSKGHIWLTGCDRWQQLGLGASTNGTSGYTWERLWQESFQRNDFLLDFIKSKSGESCNDNSTLIRDVAIGGDHTLVLAFNQKDVYSFGKGAEGQLGIVTKPFVSCPTLAKELSIKESDDRKIGAVCAIRHCSFTLDEGGKVMKRSGKCRFDKDLIMNAVKDCIEYATVNGLLPKRDEQNTNEQ